jgi:hypothetical protein
MKWLDDTLDLLLYLVLLIITVPFYFAMKLIDWIKEK